MIIFIRMARILEIFKKHPALIVLSIGLVYRLIFLLNYISTPDWNQLLVDSLFHDRWAMAIASGNILGEDVFFRAPFYIYILGFIYSIVGHSLLAARIFGHLVGLVSVLLTFSIASRLFTRRAGIIAGLILAVYPIAIYFESELLVDNLFTMLTLLSIWLLFISGDRKQDRLYFLTGIVIGLAAITRPLILALVPLYMIWILLSIKPIQTSLKRNVILLLAMFLVILPVTVRNYLIADDPVLISSSGGINFYIGNNSGADGLSASMPPPYGRNWEIKDIRFIAENETGRELKASEISNFWYKKGFDWIAENPGKFGGLYIKKLYHCINGFEVSNNRDLSFFMSELAAFKINPVNFSIIFALAVFSLFLMIQCNALNKEKIYVLAFVICYFALISVFFINARFRLPVIPFIIVLGSYGIDYFLSAFNSAKTFKKLVPAILIGCGAFALSATNIYNLDKSGTAGGNFNRANYYLYQDDFDKAAEYYHRVLREDPFFADASLNLGVIHLRRGLADSAEYYFRREINNFPENPRAYSNLASLYLLEKDYDRAEEMAQKALSIKPYFADAFIILMRVYHAVDNKPAFEDILGRAVELAPEDSRIYLNAGLVYSGWKEYNQSIEMLTMALEYRDRPAETNDLNFNYIRSKQNSPRAIKAQAAYQLGYIYGILDRIPESIDMSNRAISLDSGLVEAYINLINAYSISGRSGSAREILNIATAKFPENDLLQLIQDKLR